ncbi:hypothetical protein PG987_004906 [Apiospora arundinis]
MPRTTEETYPTRVHLCWTLQHDGDTVNNDENGDGQPLPIRRLIDNKMLRQHGQNIDSDLIFLFALLFLTQCALTHHPALQNSASALSGWPRSSRLPRRNSTIWGIVFTHFAPHTNASPPAGGAVPR